VGLGFGARVRAPVGEPDPLLLDCALNNEQFVLSLLAPPSLHYFRTFPPAVAKRKSWALAIKTFSFQVFEVWESFLKT
jgi:hypothetical protein